MKVIAFTVNCLLLCFIEAPEFLDFNEFENWYFFSSSLHAAAWEDAAKAPEAVTQNIDQRFREEFDDYEETVDVNIRSIKSIFPLGNYSAPVLVNFFSALSDEDGTINEATFYSAFDKLLQTKKSSPRASISPYDELTLDLSISNFFSTFTYSESGRVSVFDLLCALLVFAGDSPARRALAVLNLMQIYFYGNSEFDDEEQDIEYVTENDMAAALLPVLKILLAFSPASEGCSSGYLCATLTVEAFSTSPKMTVLVSCFISPSLAT